MAVEAQPVAALRFSGLLRRPVGPTTSDLGWAVWPRGLEDALVDFHRRYRVPLLVTENGIACASDEKRPSYLEAHILAVERAVARGADVRGYYHWSLLDNFEWHEGFAPRFGLFAVDYETQARRPRPSADLYRRLILERSPAGAAPPAMEAAVARAAEPVRVPR